MGVVHLERRAVRATSRNAGLFIGNLSKFLHASVPAINDPRDDLGDYSGVTYIYEKARRRTDQGAAVNQDPLHHRHIVNVVIKGRMKRDWQHKDVYLHEYHKDWKQYHLIGASEREGAPEESLENDRRIAEERLQDALRLPPRQYEFSRTINPEVKSIKHISETTGAYTDYTYRVFVVQKIDVRLSSAVHLKEDLDHGPFRWFTWEEIQAECGAQNEPIIFSTPELMKELPLLSLPLGAAQADDVRDRSGILKELGNRFTRWQLAAAALVLVLFLLLQLVPWLVAQLDIPDTALIRIAAWAQVVSAVVAVGTGLGVVLRALASTS